MSAWPVVQIKEVARVVGGATPKSGASEYWDGNIPWTTPKDLSDLDDKYLLDTPRKITEAGLKSCSSELLPVNSVLFSSRAPIGHVAINSVPIATNQGFKSFVPGSKLDASYLFWWLKCHRDQLERLGNGATFKEVSKAVVERIEIPLPPLDEQKRIAAILDQVDELRRKRQLAISHLNQLGHAIFYEMFGDFDDNSKAFDKVALEKLIKVQGGYAFKSDLFTTDGDPVIRISNVDGRSVDMCGATRIAPYDVGKGAAFKVSSGDLLIAMSGATTGKIGIVPYFQGNAYLNQRVGKYVILNNALLDRGFLIGLVQTKFYQKRILDQAWGAAQPNVSSTQLVSFDTPLPPIALQKQYASAISQLESHLLKSYLSNSILNKLFTSLQYRAFKGEL